MGIKQNTSFLFISIVKKPRNRVMLDYSNRKSRKTIHLILPFMYSVVNIIGFYFNWLAVGYLKGFRSNQSVLEYILNYYTPYSLAFNWHNISPDVIQTL